MPNSYRLMPEKHEAVAAMAITDLDLRRLCYFVTFAGELDFGRAADLVYMTQPALSRQVSALVPRSGNR